MDALAHTGQLYVRKYTPDCVRKYTPTVKMDEEGERPCIFNIMHLNDSYLFSN